MCRKVDEVGARDGARGLGGRGLRRRSVREPRAERVDDHRHRVIVRREAAAAAAGLARRNSRLGFKSRRRVSHKYSECRDVENSVLRTYELNGH